MIPHCKSHLWPRWADMVLPLLPSGHWTLQDWRRALAPYKIRGVLALELLCWLEEHGRVASRHDGTRYVWEVVA